MIELIFVIVILGILAAVAIPRLAATRDDANIAKAAQELSTAVSDITAYYTARGSFDDSNDMTNVGMSADANLTTGWSYVVDNQNCVDFNSTAAAAADGNFTVGMNAVGAGASALCTDVQAAIAGNDLNRTYSVGGQRVQW